MKSDTATESEAAIAAALSKEEDTRLAFNDARSAALAHTPRELWTRANDAVNAAIDGAPAKLREAARAAGDEYLAARKAVDRAYADAFEASLDGGEDR